MKTLKDLVTPKVEKSVDELKAEILEYLTTSFKSKVANIEVDFLYYDKIGTIYFQFEDGNTIVIRLDDDEIIVD